MEKDPVGQQALLSVISAKQGMKGYKCEINTHS